MTALSRRLRLLMLEDSPIDAELTMARLSSAGIEFDADRVEEREAFRAALERGGYDAILADFSLPSFDGLSALAMARELRPGVPFIFVSGKLGEEIAVDSLKRGASDYVLKQRLERLAPALERAIGDAAIRAQQRRADAALRATEERARLALAAGRMATWERDLASDRLIWSPEARHVFHFAADRMPATHAEFRAHVHPEDRERLDAIIGKAVEAGGEFALDFRFLRPEGEPRWIQASGRVVTNGDGEAARIVGVGTDITERRFADDHLRRVQRMEAMARIAGGVAHEANNQMTVVQGFADFVLRRDDLPGEVRGDVEQIRMAAERTAAIVQQLLAFSRRQVTKPETINLNAFITGFIPVLERTLGENIRLETALDCHWEVLVDRGQLGQVMLNLALNARDAMPDGGVVTITCADLAVAPGSAGDGLQYVVRPGEYVRITLRDTGVGMSTDTIDRIFEPFFTTKAVGQGTGLGLASVYGIIKQADGYVRASSEVGEWTEFEVLLPRAVRTVVAQGEQAASRGGTERVLIVEDEPAVRRTAARALREAGYDTVEAAHAHEAVTVVRTQGDSIALVLTDVAMPGTNGRELADELALILPGVPVLFMSGYSSEADRPALGEGRRFIAKPFGPEALRTVVREMLDERLARR